jgi:hypothetical protein
LLNVAKAQALQRSLSCQCRRFILLAVPAGADSVWQTQQATPSVEFNQIIAPRDLMTYRETVDCEISEASRQKRNTCMFTALLRMRTKK